MKINYLKLTLIVMAEVLFLCGTVFSANDFLIAGGAKNQDGALIAACPDGFVAFWQGVDADNYYQMHSGKISLTGEVQELSGDLSRLGAARNLVAVNNDHYFLEWYAHNEAWGQDGNPTRLSTLQWTGGNISVLATQAINTRNDAVKYGVGPWATNGKTWCFGVQSFTGRGGNETANFEFLSVNTGAPALNTTTLPGWGWGGATVASGFGAYLVVHGGMLEETSKLYATRFNDSTFAQLSSDLIYDAGVNSVSSPRLATGSNGFLLVYCETNAESGRVRLKARMLSSAASLVVGNAFDVTPTPPDTFEQIDPVVAYDEYSGNYLVVWQQGRPFYGKEESNIYGARINEQGEVLDAVPLTICTAAGLQERPRLSYNSGTFLVTWNDMRNGADFDIYGAILTPLTFGDTGKGYLSVTLVDTLTQQKVTTNASVQLIRNSAVVKSKTDSIGTFILPADSGSGFSLSVTAAGYLPKTISSIAITGGRSTKVTVQCVRQTLAGIAVAPDTVVLLPNSQAQLGLNGIYTDGTVMPVDGSVVPEWTSRSTGLVTVSSTGELASSTAAGTCFVTAAVTALGFSDSAFIRVVSAYQMPLYHWTLDETSGTIANDITGHGNTATLQGGPMRGAGKYGSALTFDGVDDYLSTNLQVAAPNIFTVAFWFKTTSVAGGNIMGLGGNKTGNSTDMDRIINMGTNGKLTFWCYPNSYQAITSTAAYNDGAWHQVVASISKAGMKLYVDTVLVASNTAVTSGQSYNAYWRMGADNAPFFNGQLDDIRVYDKALSAAEVALLNTDSVTFATKTDTIVFVPDYVSLGTSPNPFNPSVTIAVTGWKAGTELKILSISGKVVANLTSALNNGAQGAKVRQVMWNAAGHASGVYIVMLKNGKTELKRKAMLIR